MRRITFKAPSGAVIPFTELGLGSAPLGNLYHSVAGDAVADTLDAAWNAGLRFFDTAPFYGLGLAETRLNPFFRGKKRDDFVVATKVGRLLQVCPPAQRAGIGKFFDTPSRREVFDYTYDGVMRSLEMSFERLGLDCVDILFVHDIDVATHGSAALRDAHVETLLKPKSGGLEALRQLRDQKVIKAIGAGVNEWEVAETLLRRADLDLFLLAGRYTLLEQTALDSFLPLCTQRGVGIVVGGAYNSGILASGADPADGAQPMYNYEPAPPAIRERVRGIEKICAQHGVKLVEAALRFPLMHPAIVSVIPGATSPEHIALNMKTLAAAVPAALWRDLQAAGYVRPEAPISA